MKRIQTRLVFAFLCIIVLLFLQGMVAYRNIKTISTIQTEAYDQRLHINDLELRLAGVRLQVFKILGTMNPDQMDLLKEEYKKESSYLEMKLAEIGIDKETIDANFQTYSRIIALHYDFNVRMARRLIDEESKVRHETLVSKLRSLSHIVQQKSEDRIEKNYTRTLRFTFGLLALTLAVAILLAILIAGTVIDRQQAENELKSSEEKYRQVVENATEGIFVIQDNAYRYVNERGAEIFGTTRDRILSGEIYEFVHPDDRAMCDARVQLRKQGEITEEILVHRIIDGSGNIKWVEVRGVSIIWENRHASMCFVSDITDRKRAEMELLNEKLLSEEYINSLPGLFYVFDKKRFVRWNKQWEIVTGYSPEELANIPGSGLFEGSDKELVKEKVRKAFHEGMAEVEVQLITKDGKRIPYFFNGLRKIFNGRLHLVGLGIDITDRKLEEVERERLQAQLAQAMKMDSVGRLAGGVAHDFNNMLGVILGHAEMALDQMDSDHPLHTDIEAIKMAAHRSAELTRQLLAFARKQTVAPKVLELNDTVSGMLQMLRRLVGEHINLIWLPVKGLWPVKMDSSQIDQLLANLCVNARDAIAGVGKITIETRNVVFDEAGLSDHADVLPGEYVMLAVSDDGHGMEQEVIENLFEPFFTTKSMGRGTGLGLATVYGIVKQNQGFINVYSEPGKGSTFKIYLPRHEGEAAQVRVEEPAVPVGRNGENRTARGGRTLHFEPW